MQRQGSISLMACAQNVHQSGIACRATRQDAANAQIRLD